MERMLANPPVESTEDLEPEIDSDLPPLDSTEEGEEMDVGDDPTKEQKSE
jgi:hypothetical protein